MQLYPVHQSLASAPLADVGGEVHRRLDSLGLDPPRGPVAVTGGSRGIANIATILRECGAWLRTRGAEPFLVPAMGSHNGATAEGQRAMLESLGMTEAAVDMPIRSSMDAVAVGITATGETVWMDRHCHEAVGVLVVNRVKLHTSFGGPPYGGHCESGLVKMMTVGMGKLEGARSFHAASTADKPSHLLAMGRTVLGAGKVWAGLAILEDGLDQTAELHAMPAEAILSREPELLAHYAATYYPRLPVDRLNVLIVDAIGKNYSGTGMDTNVIGRRGLSDAPDPSAPAIGSIAALSLSPESHGNAIGVGLADVITQDLRDAIDLEKTSLNASTAGAPRKAEIPLVLPDKPAVVDWLRDRHGETRWLRIPNTLHLSDLLVSADLREELLRGFANAPL